MRGLRLAGRVAGGTGRLILGARGPFRNTPMRIPPCQIPSERPMISFWISVVPP